MSRPPLNHELCHRDDIADNSSKGFEVAGRSLFAVKKRGSLFIYQNRCPHVGLPLNWMPDKFLDIDGDLIQCSSHGALFRIDNGQCVSGPCPGQRLHAIEFVELDGKIYIGNNELL